MLHFAPEPIIATRIRAIAGDGYIAADLMPEIFDLPDGIQVEKADITALPWPDHLFDKVIVCHVLEHVPDDAQAMRELRRVVRPVGEIISQHPFDPDRVSTYEDETITTAEERLQFFGQAAHVRVYGRDLLERWRSAGFTLDVTEDAKSAGSTLVRATPSS